MSDAEKDILYAGEQTILRHKAADTITTLRAEVVTFQRSTIEWHDKTKAAEAERDAAIARAEKAEEALQKVREGVQKVIDGDYERPRLSVYLASGEHSKYDTCIHHRFVYNDCDECVCASLRASLTEGE